MGLRDSVRRVARFVPVVRRLRRHCKKCQTGNIKSGRSGGDGRIWQIDAATGAETAPPDKFAPPAGKAYALNLDGDYVYTVQAQGCGGATYQVDAYNIKTRRTTAFYPGGGGLWGRRGVTVDAEGRAYQGTGDGPFDPANKQLGEVFIQLKPDASGCCSCLAGMHRQTLIIYTSMT